MKPSWAPTNWVIWAGLVGLSAFLTLPAFQNGPIIGHDLLYHLHWNALFQEQFFSGDYYPRWLFEMNGGRGSPVFYFYNPLPYFIATFFTLLFNQEDSAWLSMGFAVWFALSLSSIGIYLYIRTSTKRAWASLITLGYLLFPYHLVVDLYIRFAYAELIATAWVPFLLIFTRELARGNHAARWKVALFTSLIILSHIPTTLLITPFLVIYYLLERTAGQKPLSILFPLAWGGVLSSVYLAPILAFRDAVSMQRMAQGHLLYENAFLMVGDQLFSSYADFWRVLNLLGVASFAIVFLIHYSRHEKTRLSQAFDLTGFFALFMMYACSEFLWRLLPPLQIVQFPWRFFILLSFIIFIMAAERSRQGDDGQNRMRTHLGRLACLLFVIVSMATLVVVYKVSDRDAYRAMMGTEIFDFIERNQETREGATEYLPRGVPEKTFIKVREKAIDTVKELIGSNPVVNGMAHRRDGDKLILGVNIKERTTLTVRQFYFPTWSCQKLESGEEIPLHADDAGFIEMEIEAGRHTLILTHRVSQIEIMGITLSLIGLVWLFLQITLRRPDMTTKGL